MERKILNEEGQNLLKSLGLEDPYALYDQPARLAEGPEDWGDAETVGLFVRRRDTSIGPYNYGQWAGLRLIPLKGDPPGMLPSLKPAILLRAFCSGLYDPVRVPGKPAQSATAAARSLLRLLLQSGDAMEKRETMRALASRDGLTGLLVFDTVVEMKEAFQLD